VKPADVFHRAALVSLAEPVRRLPAGLAVAPERPERQGEPEAQVHGPPPAVGAEGLLGAHQRLFEERQCAVRGALVVGVEADIDQRAGLDVDVGNSRRMSRRRNRTGMSRS
jgi:hypothetical protein